jgi:diacylglycerol kinase (ATP)
MRAAAILGLGCSPKKLTPFQVDKSIEWREGMPESAEQADVILLFGGDGTLHRHLDQLVELGLPVLVVPAGSGNDFARALGLGTPRDSLAAWRRFYAARDNVRAVDLGIVRSLENRGQASDSHQAQYFCSIAGIGLDAEVTRRANRLPRWLRGHGGYALTALPTIFHFAPLPMKISAIDPDGAWSVQSDQPTLMAAFANTAVYGGGMRIAPHARIDDGLLDVCVIGGINPFRLACMFPTVYFGRHVAIQGVKYFQASCLRIETEAPLDIYADGEYIRRTPAEIGIRCEALKVLTS